MEIRREKVGGLGLSVKGGAEHNLPILISRIFKDQAGNNSDLKLILRLKNTFENQNSALHIVQNSAYIFLLHYKIYVLIELIVIYIYCNL